MSASDAVSERLSVWFGEDSPEADAFRADPTDVFVRGNEMFVVSGEVTTLVPLVDVRRARDSRRGGTGLLVGIESLLSVDRRDTLGEETESS